MMETDSEESNSLGEVGKMSDRLETEVLFWRIVCTLRFPPSEVENWTLEDMRLACAFSQMQNDYKRVWSTFYEMKRDNPEDNEV